MNNEAKLDEIQSFKKFLSLRTKLKSIQQISWEVSQLDKRYPTDSLSEEDLPVIIEAYQDQLDKLKSLLSDGN